MNPCSANPPFPYPYALPDRPGSGFTSLMAIKKSELYSSLWASCDELRGGMDASQYKGYPVDIQVAEDKIVFPADKAAAKRLLLFLNEELFRGAITDQVYETNSKRVAD